MWVASKCPIAVGAMRACFQIMHLLFKEEDLRDKELRNRYISVGYGEMLGHPYVIFGLEIHMGLQCIGQKAGG